MRIGCACGGTVYDCTVPNRVGGVLIGDGTLDRVDQAFDDQVAQYFEQVSQENKYEAQLRLGLIKLDAEPIADNEVIHFLFDM